MKAKVIKSERVQKKVVKQVYALMQDVARIYGGYEAEIEEPNTQWTKVLVGMKKGGLTVDSFITRAVIQTIDEVLQDIMGKYDSVYWVVDTRRDISKFGTEYSRAVVEIHIPIEDGK